MTDVSEPKYGDPLSVPFWEAAGRHELVIQCCDACGHYQFYPRPFCLACQSDNIRWRQVTGAGVIYAITTVHLQVLPEREPPYQVALVQLSEGPRMLANIIGAGKIGDRVRIAWKERADAPPLPVFEPTADK